MGNRSNRKDPMYACIVFVVVFGFPFRVFQIRLLKSSDEKQNFQIYIFPWFFSIVKSYL